jgi:RimJ/RimL family protein N-acetyltransferase
MLNDKLSIRSVRTSIDAKFLFDLLKERDSRANISHKKMPTFTSHVKFIESKPYKKWYIIYIKENIDENKKKIGSIYLSKNNEIGIFILKKYQRKNVGNLALSELMKCNKQKRYLANVSPKNKKSLQFFKNNGFKLIQYTFEKTK